MNKIVKVNYYDDFKCSAEKCTLDCCTGWKIDIDKKTLKKYKDLKCEMKLILEEGIFIEENKSYNSYGYFKLKEDNKCKLIDEIGLCRIHKNLGEDYLCDTCKSYPRTIKRVNNNFEYGLDSSCPEVCQKLIIDNKKIVYKYEEKEIKEEYMVTKEAGCNEYDYNTFCNLRSFIIESLQCDGMPINDKVIAIGIILNKVNKYKSENRDINDLIELYKDKKEILNQIDNIEVSYNIKIDLLLEIMEIIKSTKDDIKFNKLCENISDIFSIDSEDEINATKYKQINCNEFKKCFKENEYIFENYMVNNFYNEFWIDDNEDQIMELYFKLVISFSMLKFFIMGEYIKNDKNINKEKLIDIMVIISRKINNDNVFVKSLKSLMEESGMDVMIYLMILLKE